MWHDLDSDNAHIPKKCADIDIVRKRKEPYFSINQPTKFVNV